MQIDPQNLRKLLWSEMSTMSIIRAAWVTTQTSIHILNRAVFNGAVPILRNSILQLSKHVSGRT